MTQTPKNTNQYPPLSEEDKESFMTWLKMQGYSDTYSRAIPYYHYAGEKDGCLVSRARELFDAWLGDHEATCRPRGPHNKVPSEEVNESEENSEPYEEDESEEDSLTENIQPKNWDLVIYICRCSISDELKRELIYKILE